MSWLVMVGHLSSAFDDELGSAFRAKYCNVSDMGFSDGAHGAIKDRPPRPDSVPYDTWCSERFAFVQPDDTIRTVGRVEICEGYVYDNRYRADIDFTGIKITISLRSDVYAAYVEYVGRAKVPELMDFISWNGGIVFRIPSSRFSFPMPWGSSKPWDNKNVVGKLKPIKRFNFDSIEIQLLRDGQNRRVALEEGPGADKTELKPALCIGEVSGSPRWWARLLPS